MGYCQVKKKLKIREKVELARPHPPIHFFINLWKHVQQQKNTHNTHKKTKNVKKKIIIRVGSLPTHPLPIFSRIFGFFQLKKTPKAP